MPGFFKCTCGNLANLVLTVCEACASKLEVATPTALTNSDLMPLLKRCQEYIYGVSGRSVTGDTLLNDINAVLAQ